MYTSCRSIREGDRGRDPGKLWGGLFGTHGVGRREVWGRQAEALASVVGQKSAVANMGCCPVVKRAEARKTCLHALPRCAASRAILQSPRAYIIQYITDCDDKTGRLTGIYLLSYPLSVAYLSEQARGISQSSGRPGHIHACHMHRLDHQSSKVYPPLII